MKLFKNGIDRPNNETIKKRKSVWLWILIILLIVVILSLIVFFPNKNIVDKDTKKITVLLNKYKNFDSITYINASSFNGTEEYTFDKNGNAIYNNFDNKTYVYDNYSYYENQDFIIGQKIDLKKSNEYLFIKNMFKALINHKYLKKDNYYSAIDAKSDYDLMEILGLNQCSVDDGFIKSRNPECDNSIKYVKIYTSKDEINEIVIKFYNEKYESYNNIYKIKIKDFNKVKTIEKAKFINNAEKNTRWAYKVSGKYYNSKKECVAIDISSSLTITLTYIKEDFEYEVDAYLDFDNFNYEGDNIFTIKPFSDDDVERKFKITQDGIINEIDSNNNIIDTYTKSNK